MILSFGTCEKVKLFKARHRVEMTVARQPDLLECCFGPFGNSKPFMAINMMTLPSARDAAVKPRQPSVFVI